MSIKYRMNAEVKEEALSYVHQIEILIDHLYRNSPADQGIAGVSLDELRKIINEANDTGA